MVERKYEFTGETIEHSGTVTLHRIRAVRDFDDVKVGDVGGWIESEHNLSHNGDCWLYGNSKVFECGQVGGNAKIKHSNVFNNAQILGNITVCSSNVYDSAVVIGRAQIEQSQLGQHARISGGSQICKSRIGNYARIEGSVVKGADIGVPCHIRHGHIESSRDLLTIGPIGSEDGTLTAYRGKSGILVTRGCFTGTLGEFTIAVENRHGDNLHGRLYQSTIEFIELYFSEDRS
ncbi:hypothetical protein [Paenibacillus popilliae]|uniref:Uncharacterized protein n=1 Tax=Paenibacillus popilliae ATCC 14706 TaxID=1212764 RepID=M9M1K1_PAEPP|nr:hypothetical protein [Paenibacillus popilliae]GAC42784.1 hypothetical protein PPOP_2144 [Paenibacillus popilliae ATCC 14706]